jgi:hypothetical protein
MTNSTWQGQAYQDNYRNRQERSENQNQSYKPISYQDLPVPSEKALKTQMNESMRNSLENTKRFEFRRDIKGTSGPKDKLSGQKFSVNNSFKKKERAPPQMQPPIICGLNLVSNGPTNNIQGNRTLSTRDPPGHEACKRKDVNISFGVYTHDRSRRSTDSLWPSELCSKTSDTIESEEDRRLSIGYPINDGRLY